MKSWLSGREAEGIYIQHVRDIFYFLLTLQPHSKLAEVFLKQILEEQPIRNYNNLEVTQTLMKEERKRFYGNVSQMVKKKKSSLPY